MIYLLINNIITAILIIVAYNFGLRNRQKIDNNEQIKVVPNPVKSIQDHKKQKEIEVEIDKLNTIMNNINSYDGTNNGQVEVVK